MPGTYRLDPWLEAAKPIFMKAVTWRNIPWERLDDMGGPFLLAAHAVKERNARASDDREMARRAEKAWEYYESQIRADAARHR